MDAALSRLVWQRARSCCEYCQIHQDYDEATFEIDHIIAKKHGGPTVASNLCLSCLSCNSFKGSDIASRDMRTRKLVQLFNPADTVGRGTFAGMAQCLSVARRLAASLLRS